MVIENNWSIGVYKTTGLSLGIPPSATYGIKSTPTIIEGHTSVNNTEVVGFSTRDINEGINQLIRDYIVIPIEENALR